MYKKVPFPASVLIVKTSSLGDIIQAFNVLDDLHHRFPGIAVDWAVEAPFYSVVAAHPLVRRAIPRNDLRALRRERYDLLFDLQANCKSGLVTFLARAQVKVGYAFQSVREWPNILATHVRFAVSKEQNIRLYYLELLARYFGTPAKTEISGLRFRISSSEQEQIAQIVQRASSSYRIMVCPGSKWVNKRLNLETLIAFLQKIEAASFLLVWGDAEEKALCEQIQRRVPGSFLVDKLPIPVWQNLMHEVSLLIAVDSSALHLCGTTSTPTLSLFGPTSPAVFKPMGPRHLALQGPCPYRQTFQKQCPRLRTCPTGACIKSLTPEELFAVYQSQRAPRRP